MTKHFVEPRLAAVTGSNHFLYGFIRLSHRFEGVNGRQQGAQVLWMQNPNRHFSITLLNSWYEAFVQIFCALEI